MLGRANHIDATRGPLTRMIIMYAIPLMISSLVQLLFNAVDIVVLGNMATTAAVAAVGATTSIIYLLVNTFMGLSSGTRVILTRQIGAGDEAGAKKTIDTSLITGFCIGVIIMIFGFFLSPLFLQITNCPTDCYDGALLYIRIYVCAAPAILIYNYGSAVLNSMGDTRHPMLYIIACGCLNVILNMVLCLVLEEKVAAVAIATAAAQVLGAFLVVHRLCKNEGFGKLILLRMRWKFASFQKILRFGLPMAVTSALYPLADLQIQSAINSYGVAAVAGNSAAITIEGIGYAMAAFGSAASVFMGQNLGAENHERVRESFRKCLRLCFLCTGLMGALLFFTGRFWLGIILTNDTVAVDYGMVRMLFVTLFMFVFGTNHVLTNALQAFGNTFYTAITSLGCIFGIRMLWMILIYPQFQTFHWLMAGYLVSWLLLMVFNIVGFGVVYARFKKGIVKRI